MIPVRAAAQAGAARPDSAAATSPPVDTLRPCTAAQSVLAQLADSVLEQRIDYHGAGERWGAASEGQEVKGGGEIALRRGSVLVLTFETENLHEDGGERESFSEILICEGEDWVHHAAVPGGLEDTVELNGDTMPELIFEARNSTVSYVMRRWESTRGSISVYAFDPIMGYRSRIHQDFYVESAEGPDGECDRQGSNSQLAVEEAAGSLPVVVVTTTHTQEGLPCGEEIPQTVRERYTWSRDDKAFVRLPP